VRGQANLAVFVHHVGINRAMDGDVVALQLLPKNQWAVPSGIVERLEGSRFVVEGAQVATPASGGILRSRPLNPWLA
jgi:hypothetical protein